MTDKTEKKQIRLPLWAGGLIVAATAAVVIVLGLLSVSVMERRWEAQRPMMVVKPIADFEPDNAVWGQNWPREYETYRKTEISDTQTLFGGSFPRDYLEADPYQVVLFAGYGFSEDYKQARGHYWAVNDARETKRVKKPDHAATCWTCKSTDVPRLMNSMGARAFYASNFHDLTDQIKHPIGCQDCHDPATMRLRITRPGLIEGFAAMGKDISQATHQQMRSLVCAQCHVEYYFANEAAADKKNYLTFPWHKGTTVESMLDYYDAMDFSDYIHPVSKTPIVKAQHPDYELYQTGIHAYRGVSCADCHMPYFTEGGMKFTDHHVRSPLQNISSSCAVCHRWSEQEIRSRVETIQTKVYETKLKAEKAIVSAHFDVAEAVRAGATDQMLKSVRTLIRHAQFRWDYVSASNGMGFHSPQECMRILADAIDQAQQARVLAAQILARQGIKESPAYPDLTTRQNALQAIAPYLKP
ncbi:MAG: ammonia-forming cytochrome c nitrite reductase subunit c552 [Sedimentisphaerales bacterium]|nr:ammonia-forming cytochrome c nitrite reductase subunit c552 [Sedimentisphaerales bacterium]